MQYCPGCSGAHVCVCVCVCRSVDSVSDSDTSEDGGAAAFVEQQLLKQLFFTALDKGPSGGAAKQDTHAQVRVLCHLCTLACQVHHQRQPRTGTFHSQLAYRQKCGSEFAPSYMLPLHGSAHVRGCGS